MRVLVCGGRDFNDRRAVFATLDKVCGVDPGQLPPAVTIIHGAASGADALADEWAGVNWVNVEAYPAQWRDHGRAAGPIRNQKMIDEGRPDLVVAFPGGRGTADMVRRAKSAGLAVKEISQSA